MTIRLVHTPEFWGITSTQRTIQLGVHTMGFNYKASTMLHTQGAPYRSYGKQLDGGDLNTRDALACMSAAEMDWTVGIKPILRVTDAAAGTVEVIKSHGEATIIESNKPLGVVGSGQELVQNSELFGMAQAVIDQNDDAELVQAGTCDSGGRVWAVVGRNTERSITRTDGSLDPIKQLTLLVNDHCGKGSFIGLPILDRLFCGNQLAGMIRRAKRNGIFRIRHSGNMGGKLAVAERMLLDHDKYTTELVALYQQLAETGMTLDAFTEYAETVATQIGGELKAEPTPFETSRRSAEVNDLRGLFAEGAGNTGETRWDAYNAVTDWLDHHRQAYRQSADADKRADRRFQNSVMPNGASVQAKSDALQILTSIH